MPLVAEVVDVVVGGDTHKDTHALEMLSPVGAAVARLRVGNDDAGFATVVAWIAEHAAGARVLVGLEGTRCYGVGLARALTRAGLTVVEVERPKREQRRGRGSPIRSTRIWLALRYCVWTPIGCRARVRTEISAADPAV